MSNEFELDNDEDGKSFDIDSRGAVLEESPDLLRLRLRTAKERIFREYYQVGRDLYFVLKGEMYKKWNYEKFSDYVDAEVGLSLKYAMNYVKVFKKFNKSLGFGPEQLEGIGVTKALVLTDKAITRENAQEWIEKARSKTTNDLREALNISKPKKHTAVPRNSPEAMIGLAKAGMDESLLVEDSDEQPIIKTFYLFPRQLEFVESSLVEMQPRTGSDKEGHNLCSLILEHQTKLAALGGKTDYKPKTVLEGFEATFGGVVLWVKTKEQYEALVKFMTDNPDIFKEDTSND